MSDETAIEVIRLRHRLRALASQPPRGAAGARSSAVRSAQHEPARTFLGAPFAVDDDSQPGPQETLARFRSLSETLGDPELLFEYARWQVFFEQLHP